LGVYTNSTGGLIGDIGLHFLAKNSNSAEIGYTIAPEHQRKGYAFEGIERVLAYLFETFKISQVFADVIRGNTASIALLQKLGAQQVNVTDHQNLIQTEEGDLLF